MNRNLVLIGAGLGLVLVVAAAWAAKRGAAAVGAAVNPLNSENIVNQGVTGAVSELTGRDETLGGWLAGVFDPATRRVDQLYRIQPWAPPLVGVAPRGEFWLYG